MLLLAHLGGSSVKGQDGDKVVKEITLTDAGILLSYSSKVYIVPGYGLAVAQAQQVCKDLTKLFEDKGVEVSLHIPSQAECLDI